MKAMKEAKKFEEKMKQEQNKQHEHQSHTEIKKASKIEAHLQKEEKSIK